MCFLSAICLNHRVRFMWMLRAAVQYRGQSPRSRWGGASKVMRWWSLGNLTPSVCPDTPNTVSSSKQPRQTEESFDRLHSPGKHVDRQRKRFSVMPLAVSCAWKFTQKLNVIFPVTHLVPSIHPDFHWDFKSFLDFFCSSPWSKELQLTHTPVALDAWQ